MLIFILFIIYHISCDECEPEFVFLTPSSYQSMPNSLNLTLVINTNYSCESQKLIIKNQVIPISTYRSLRMNIFTNYFSSKYLQYQHVYSFNIINNSSLTYAIQNNLTFYNYTIINNAKNMYKYVFIGDVDASPSALPTFNAIYQSNLHASIDSLFILGDLAYDLDSEDFQYGEQFSKVLSNLSAIIPTIVTPGNHDRGKNKMFEYFRMNFLSPCIYPKLNESFNFVCRFTHGLAQFITINLYEQIEFDEVVPGIIDKLKQMLIESLGQRRQYPWLIVYSHYPLICQNVYNIQCQKKLRTLVPIEKLLNNYNVDFIISGHIHEYQRFEPVNQFNESIYSQFQQDPFGRYIKDAQGPIQLIDGIAGNDYFLPTNIDNGENEHLKNQSIELGYGQLTIFNQTHCKWEQFNQQSEIIDFLWVQKSFLGNQQFGFTIIVMAIVFVLFIIVAVSFGYFCYVHYKKPIRTPSAIKQPDSPSQKDEGKRIIEQIQQIKSQ